MFYPILPALVKAYQDELIADAEQTRLPTHVRVVRPRFRHRFLGRVGALLIFAGLWLRERYEPALYSQPKAYRSGC